MIPPLIGAVAAVVIYVFFQSRVLTSPIFPVFDCKLEPPLGPDGCSAFEHFFDFGPKGMVDYAKVLLWAFVAGFSERFVPDLVAKLARKFDEI